MPTNPLVTTTVPSSLAISSAEVTRVNFAIADLDTTRALLAIRDATIATQATTIADLRAQLVAAIPAPVPVPTPTPVRTSFYVDGPTLRTPKGAAFSPRGIECLWGPTSAADPTKAVAALKALGANMIAPIFQLGQSTAAHVRACLAAAKAAGLVVAVNADAEGVDRLWLKRPDIVAECNAATNVAMLECEVELGDHVGTSPNAWRDTAIAFVLDLRAAGHKSPIRVGSPSGGRFVKYALDMLAAVNAADPLRACVGTWQAYWKAAESTGWSYASDSGMVASGTAGALECADKIKATGLCWLVGLDGADDVGPTPYAELAARLHTHGIGWQWWAMLVGDSYGNGLVSDALRADTLKSPFGPTVKALLTAQTTALGAVSL